MPVVSSLINLSGTYITGTTISYGGLAAEYGPLAAALEAGDYNLNNIALQYQIDLVQAAANAGVDTVIGFLGSNIWHLLYRF